MCWDLTEKKFVALKVVKSASHYTGGAKDLTQKIHIIETEKVAKLSSNPGSYFSIIFAQKPLWTR